MEDIKAQIVQLSENNLGAADVMILLTEYLTAARHYNIKTVTIGDLLGLLEALKIRGEAIYILFKKLAKQEIDNFIGILTAVGHVLFSEIELKEAIIKGEFSRPGVLKEIADVLAKNFPEYEIKMVY